MKVSLVFAAFLATLAIGSAQLTDKLPIQVFVGSLCPDAIRFVQNQLNPLYPQMKDYVDFTFIPFGKAHSTRDAAGNLTFTCQHGVDDCHVSRIQMCAISNMMSDRDAIMEFIACQMAFGSDRSGLTCSNRVGLDYSRVMNCYNNRLGELLQMNAERMTNDIQYPLDWVPTITFNWTFNKDLSRRSESNLKTVVCEQLRYSAPFCLL